MATLDISIINSALPTIQADRRQRHRGYLDRNIYLVVEVVIIPLSAWLERSLGLRKFALISAIFFSVSSVLCGISTLLKTMIIGRNGRGLSGGAMIPTR